MASRYLDKGDVRIFLKGLRAKRAELAIVGVQISDDDYRSTIVQSLPRSLAAFAASLLAAARLHDSLHKTIEPETLIAVLYE